MFRTAVEISDALGEDTLLCPACHQGNLHHHMVTVFARKRYEDGDTTAHVIARADSQDTITSSTVTGAGSPGSHGGTPPVLGS